MRSDLYCQSCTRRNCTYEPFIDISLSLDINDSNFNNNGIDLIDCLYHFTSMEPLSELVVS